MAEAAYTLEKVKIGGVYHSLRVRVDADSIAVTYDGKALSLAAALEKIGAEITGLKNEVGNAENLLKTI